MFRRSGEGQSSSSGLLQGEMVSPNAPRRQHGAHAHDHGGHAAGSRRRLLAVLILTAAYMFAEGAGGWLTGSLALLADAGHMLADVAALALALLAAWFAARPATSNKPYGYYRLAILAAFANGVVLVLVSLRILYEAYERWAAPPEISRGGLMTAVAAGGLLTNLLCAWLLHGEHTRDLNVRGAWLHVLGDALGSVGAIAAGALVLGLGWYKGGPLFSALIALLLVWRSWNLMRAAANVPLEGTPAHLHPPAVAGMILETQGLQSGRDP